MYKAYGTWWNKSCVPSVFRGGASLYLTLSVCLSVTVSYFRLWPLILCCPHYISSSQPNPNLQQAPTCLHHALCSCTLLRLYSTHLCPKGMSVFVGLIPYSKGIFCQKKTPQVQHDVLLISSIVSNIIFPKYSTLIKQEIRKIYHSMSIFGETFGKESNYINIKLH